MFEPFTGKYRMGSNKFFSLIVRYLLLHQEHSCEQIITKVELNKKKKKNRSMTYSTVLEQYCSCREIIVNHFHKNVLL